MAFTHRLGVIPSRADRGSRAQSLHFTPTGEYTMQSGHRGRSHELHLTCVSRAECLWQYKASAVEVSMSATTTSPANDGRAATPPHLVWGRGSTPSGKNDGRLPSPLPLLQKAGPTPASMHPLSHATRTASLPVSAHVLRPPG